jgi:hypothetical protein
MEVVLFCFITGAFKVTVADWLLKEIVSLQTSISEMRLKLQSLKDLRMELLR